MGLLSQAINPKKAVNINIESINKDNETANSFDIPMSAKKNIRVASLVPTPEIEIGIKVNNPATVTLAARYKKDIFILIAKAKR